MSGDWRDAYRGKRVLVTGNSGFKGVWLSAFLARLGGDVTGISRRPDSELFQSAGDRGRTLYCDVRDPAGMAEILTEQRPQIIFHLAAQPLVRQAYEAPAETFEINAQGTVNMLDAVRATPSVQAAVFVTTDKVYRDRGARRPFVETDELGGRDPYAASKVMAETAVETYRASYFESAGPVIATVRAGNVIGGGDLARDRLVPDFIRAIHDSQPIRLRNPEHIRPWQHVLDPLRGYLMLGARLAEGDRTFAGAWNFGPAMTDAVPVRTLVEKLIEIWGMGELESEGEAGAPHESSYLSLDSGKAAGKLGWRPILNLDEALSLTAKWYRGYFMDKSRAGELLTQQIDAYLDRIR